MTTKPFVSIIIRTLNEEKELPITLKNIHLQKFKYLYEIIIVDSGSSDNTLKIAKQYNCKILKIDSKNFSYSYALNMGAENSKGELLIFLSAHCSPVNKNWLKYITSQLLLNKKVGAVFGRELPKKGVNPVYEYSQLYEMFPPKNNTSVIFSNANSCIKKEIWKKIPFDESLTRKRGFLLIGEDALWAEAIKMEGYEIIYEPLAIVYHSHKFKVKEFTRAYSAGYFSKELPSMSPINQKRRLLRIFIYAKKQFSILFYLIKNNYYKSIFWDFPLSIVLTNFFYFLGKKDRESETF